MSDQLSVRVYDRGIHSTGIQRRERKKQMGIIKEGFEGWKPMNWWRASQSGTRADAKPRDGKADYSGQKAEKLDQKVQESVWKQWEKGEPCCVMRGDGGQLDRWANGAASWALLKVPGSGRCDEIGDLGRLVWQWCVEWTGGWRGWVKEILFAVYVCANPRNCQFYSFQALTHKSETTQGLPWSMGWVCARVLSCFSRVGLCNPMDCGPPGSSVHGTLQARILERVAMPSSRGSSWSRDRTCDSCIAGGFFTAEPPGEPRVQVGGFLNMVRPNTIPHQILSTPWHTPWQLSLPTPKEMVTRHHLREGCCNRAKLEKMQMTEKVLALQKHVTTFSSIQRHLSHFLRKLHLAPSQFRVAFLLS